MNTAPRKPVDLYAAPIPTDAEYEDNPEAYGPRSTLALTVKEAKLGVFGAGLRRVVPRRYKEQE